MASVMPAGWPLSKGACRQTSAAVQMCAVHSSSDVHVVDTKIFRLGLIMVNFFKISFHISTVIKRLISGVSCST